MTIMVDTCILMDFLQDRKHAESARQILEAAMDDTRAVQAYMTATAVTDLFYMDRKYTKSAADTKERLGTLLYAVEPVDTTTVDIDEALNSQIADLEDAVLVVTAQRLQVDWIITRDRELLKMTDVPTMTAERFIETYLSRTNDDAKQHGKIPD